MVTTSIKIVKYDGLPKKWKNNLVEMYFVVFTHQSRQLTIERFDLTRGSEETVRNRPVTGSR